MLLYQAISGVKFFIIKPYRLNQSLEIIVLQASKMLSGSEKFFYMQ